MRSEIQKQYLTEHGMDPEAEGQLIDDLFLMPKYLGYEKRKLNGGNQKMPQDFNEAVAESVPVEKPGQPAPAPTAPVPEAPVAEQPTAPQSDGFGALDDSGEIERQEFDPTPHIGKDSFIEFIEERKGQYGYYIRLLSQAIDTESMEIRASAIFGLEEDKDGKLGWAPDSKLFNFLKKFNVNHYRELLASPVIAPLKDDKGESYRRISGGMKTQVKIQTRQAKDGKEYLTF
jgi:hypothetical protein